MKVGVVPLAVAIAVSLAACGGGPQSSHAALDRNSARNAAPDRAQAGRVAPPGVPSAGPTVSATVAPAGVAASSTPVVASAGHPGAAASAATATGGARAATVAPPHASAAAAAPASSAPVPDAPAPSPGHAPGGAGPALGPGDTTGVTQSDILFGIHMPQSGPTGVLVGNGWKGIDAYFRSINDAGGVNGRRFKLVVADDKYSSQGAAGAIRELVDTKRVFAVGCPLGADACSVSVAYANSKAVPYISGGFREQYLEDKPWAFPVTTSYGYAGSRLVDYLFEKRGYTPTRKIGFFYLHSENFDELVARADQAMDRHGTRFAVKYPAEKDQSDFSAAVTKMQSAGVDTVWFHTAPDLTTKFAAQAKLLGYHPQYVFIPPAGGDLFAAAAGGNLDKAFGLAGFDDPQWPGAAPFRDMFQRYYPNDEVDEVKILCYIVGSAFVEGVRRAGPDLGRDALARGLGSIDDLDTGVSAPLSYTKRGRVRGPDSTFAVWEIHGTHTDQTTGFDF